MQAGEDEELFEVNCEEDAEDKHPGDRGAECDILVSKLLGFETFSFLGWDQNWYE